MIKKQLLVILATIVLSFSAFAQFSVGDGTENNPYQISTKAQFLAISSNLSACYKQTADIDLGDLGTLDDNKAIITGDFSGTYDGDGHSISYSVKFVGTDQFSSYGLFKKVSGTIKNLRITSSSAMLTGTAADMNIGLICGLLRSNGVITDCHVTGNINSTVNPGGGSGSDAGLIAGQSLGKIKYSSGTGNVVGVGYAGGLVGQLNDAWGHFDGDNNGEIIGCSFVGSVKAVAPDSSTTNSGDSGSFAGGICGLVAGAGVANPEISLSYANATLEGIAAYGLAYFSTQNDNIYGNDYGSYDDIYVKGEVNGNNIDNQPVNEISNISTINSGNGYNNANDNTVEINSTLNDVVDDTPEANEKIYFSRETGEIILIFGNRITCEPPTGLSLTISDYVSSQGKRYVTFDWDDAEGVTWNYTLFKGDEIIENATTDASAKVFYMQIQQDVDYTFAIHTNCSDDSHSYNVFETFKNPMPPCNTVININAENITSNSATISWNTGNGTNETGRIYEVFVICNDNSTTYTVNTNSINLTNLHTNTLYKVAVREVCSADNLSLAEIIEFKTLNETTNGYYYTVANGNFEQPGTWNRNSVPTGNNEGTITIKHEVVLNSTLTLNGNTTINIDHSNGNKGVLKINQQGQLITTSTTNDVTGIVEILTPIIGQKKWAFLGAPFVTASNDAKEYKLETIMPERGSDIIVSFYEYGNRNDWSADRDVYATYQYVAKTGEGYLGFPFYDGVVSFTSYGDLWDFNLNGGAGGIKEYDATPALYKLNNSDVTITNANSNRWTPLSNPYPAKLSIEKFLSQNSGLIQGNCVYKLANANASDFELVSTGEIKMTEGFFVKLASGVSSIDFRQTQLTDYPAQGNKSQTAEREFVELSLTADNHSSKLYFAHNEQAELGYDIFDADKLFAMTEMTEPYFLTQGIRLVKEEVNALPYYATMNVRSYENKEVSFKANNIPQGIAVSLIDGEETIELNEGVVYTTNVSSGENANRFKVLFSQSVGLNDVEELEVNITNDNRLVNITTSEKDLQIEVYNALGQRVFATKDFNFSLNNVSAGAYMIKAFNNKASKTQKIIIK